MNTERQTKQLPRQYHNFKSDLRLLVRLPGWNSSTHYPFEFSYYIRGTTNQKFTVSYQNGEATNCTLCPEGIRIHIPQNHFQYGDLYAQRRYSEPDQNFPDGTFNYLYTEDTGITLTDQAIQPKEQIEEVIEHPGTNAYEAAISGGYGGTIDEFYALMGGLENSLTGIKNAQATQSNQMVNISAEMAKKAVPIDSTIEGEQVVQGCFHFDKKGKKKQLYCRTFYGVSPTAPVEGVWRLISTYDPKHTAIRTEGYVYYSSHGQCRDVNTIAITESCHNFFGISLIFNPEYTHGMVYNIVLYYIYED